MPLSRITAQEASDARPRKTITDFTTQSARANRARKEKVSGVMAAGSMVSPALPCFRSDQGGFARLQWTVAKIGRSLAMQARLFG